MHGKNKFKYNLIFFLKKFICYIYIYIYIFFDSKFQYNFIIMSDNVFKDSSNKSKSVMKDEVGKNDI